MKLRFSSLFIGSLLLISVAADITSDNLNAGFNSPHNGSTSKPHDRGTASKMQTAEISSDISHSTLSPPDIDTHGHAEEHVNGRHAEVTNSTSNNCSGYPGSEHHGEPTVHLVSLRWKEIGAYFTITAFVLIAGLCKLGFHHLHWLSSKVPESCLLIVLGLIMGLVIYFSSHETDPAMTCHHHVGFPTFTSQAFFLILLPPIILESAYSLHDRAFMENLGSVIIFAVFGTILNIFIIGPSLFGLAVVGAMGPINITMTESLVFSSLISAVDPVAVLGIFQELSVNKGLYFLVFGESLFNDGVTVVVYNTLSVFMDMTSIRVVEYFKGILAFFIVAVCGSLIGIIFGILTALVTKVTGSVRVMEPLALLGIAYLAYLTAELFHFSGIISLIFCGLVQAQYAFQNVSNKSYTTVKYFIKMASATSETIIFMFLGMLLVSEEHVWHTGFILWTLFLCFVVRFIITLGLSAATNQFRLHPIDMSEQLIIAYGGLRGAVAFSLVNMLPEDLEHRKLFVTATLAVVLFTVFVQGITIKPLVAWLKISRQDSGSQMLIEEVHQTVVDHMMAGVDEILGNNGDASFRETLRKCNEKYFKKWLLIPSANAPLTRLFEKIAITEHYAHLYGPAVLIEQQQNDSTENLIGEDGTPYSSKAPSIQCLDTEFTETSLDQDLKQQQYAHLTPINIDVELRHSRTFDTVIGMDDLPHHQVSHKPSPRPVSKADDAKFLRNAFSTNAFNQLHKTYDKSLVNEDHQELQNHLKRRHVTARRINQMASGGSLRRASREPSMAGTPTLPRRVSVTDTKNSDAPNMISSIEGSAPPPTTAAARRLRMPMRHSHPKQSGLSHSGNYRSSLNPQEESTNGMVADDSLVEDIERTNNIIMQHRRKSVKKRQNLRSRKGASRTKTMEATPEVDEENPEQNPLLPSSMSTPQNEDDMPPPKLASFSTPADDSTDKL